MRFGKFGINKKLKFCLSAAVFAVSFFVFSAHANAANVYYSVGQNTSDHKTGSPTVTVSGTTATFSVAQTATNMGVGDLVTYAGGACHISAKTSTTVWSCVSVTGGTPTAATNASVTSIAHAFNSLSAAIAGSSDASHLNTTDLVAGNYQLNIPCYYDTGADTTPVTVSGYTTGAGNFINIYAPNNTTTEVNNSQRHQGRWDDTKFRHEIVISSSHQTSIAINNNHVTVNGLLFSGYIPDGNDKIYRAIGSGNPSNGVVIKNNVIKLRQNHSFGAIFGLDLTDPGVGANVYILNNIIYAVDTVANKEECIRIGGDSYGTYIVSNNTAENCNSGISNSSSKVVISSNNIAANSNTSDFSGTFSALSYNNISSDATAPGSSALVSQSLANISFVNTADGFEDLHLQNTSVAKGAGLNLSNDVSFPFSSDIDNQNRGVIWDIGADQITPAQVYYSVGQSAADLKSGSNPTVTITSGVAVFSEAQTGNIGVGDRVTYNTNQIAYISAKTNADGMHWSLVTALGAPAADISNSAVVSITHEFTSLSAAVTAASNASHVNNTDLVAANVVLNIPAYYDSAADTTAVTVSGYTTGASNFIKIYTPSNTSTEANNSQRHSGKWDDGKYNVSVPSVSAPITVSVGDTRIEGLQLKTISQYANGVDYLSSSNGGENVISSSIILSTFNAGNHANISIPYQTNANYKYLIENNILIGSGHAMDLNFNSNYTSVFIYNNTVANTPYFTFRGQTALVRNLAMYNVGYFMDNSGPITPTISKVSHIVSNKSLGFNTAGFTSVFENKAANFQDIVGSDFHLNPNDVEAKNLGADLSANPDVAFRSPSSFDIDGQSRPSSSNTAWDIGADEAATAIFYSVGQNTSDHKIGTPTLDIASGTATFSVAQTATNMGVGDKVTYNASTVAYISEKISQTQWKLITATGGTPADVTGQTVNSIAHAFNSLSAAEAGATGASYLNTADLVTGNYQLNFPCYYDTGSDTTSVAVDGYTTGASNYIKIYTPNNTTTEVNQSQRHQGKWDDGKYNIKSNQPIASDVGYIKIDGLQTKSTNVSNWATSIGSGGSGGAPGVSEIVISNSIITGSSSTGTNLSAINFYNNKAGTSGNLFLYNNILYGIGSAGHPTQYIATNSMYVVAYSNTVIGDNIVNDYCFGRSGLYKNNIAQNCGVAYWYSGSPNPASDYNISNVSGVWQAPGANSKNSTTVQFTDAANKDFHLSPSDTAARGSGTNLAQDLNLHFQDDIDGQQRTGIWDIGADQFADGHFNSPEASSNSITDGLVGHWTFNGEDIDGATAKDISGNNNHGTISGATVIPGKFGQGLDFNGVDNRVDVGYKSSLELPDSGGSVFSWINVDPNETLGQDMNKGILRKAIHANWNASGGYEVDLYQSGPTDPHVLKIRLGSENDVDSVTGSTNITGGQWHQVGLVWDASKIYLYLDGALEKEQTRTKTINWAYHTEGLYIGRCPSGSSCSDYFNGGIDDVRIYNRMLSVDEIGRLYRTGQAKMQTSQNNKNTDGLVGLWSFDGPDVSGNTAFDRSGSGNNGTISGATVTPGKVGQGMGFDGVNDYTRINSVAPISNMANFSVSLWVNFKSLVNNSSNPVNDLVNKAWNLWVNNTGRVRLEVSTNNVYASVNSSQNLEVKNWYHIVAIFHGVGTPPELYLNGASASSGGYGGSGLQSNDSSYDLILGAQSGNESYANTNADMDEVRVYNRALTVSEVVGLYNAGKVQIRK